jgi:hypothetical protein
MARTRPKAVKMGGNHDEKSTVGILAPRTQYQHQYQTRSRSATTKLSDSATNLNPDRKHATLLKLPAELLNRILTISLIEPCDISAQLCTFD